ncbi:hypothetical protein J8A87_22530 [Vibrio parahaemolyticus]|nr:hypothetical protein [Vibrio parahaemolyticus]ELA8197209.1 hypothetical protein [Vibrio parahaemolyticus]MCF9167228.1 hypothetical protein [Vibrio parahaemolyticus]
MEALILTIEAIVLVLLLALATVSEILAESTGNEIWNTITYVIIGLMVLTLFLSSVAIAYANKLLKHNDVKSKT